jgi:hypothetical protein
MARCQVTMRVVIPWWLTWIIAPPVIVLHHFGLWSAEKTCGVVGRTSGLRQSNGPHFDHEADSPADQHTEHCRAAR